MKKSLFIIIGVALLTIGTVVTSFAGQWKQEGTNWKYQNGDGTYASNGWHWIDGNNDGTAECYYFDGEGWMLANTTTPDGYQVDGNGAWVQNGAVQTKQVGVQAGQRTQATNQASMNNYEGNYAMNTDATLGMNIGGSEKTDPGWDWSTGTGSAGLPKFKKSNGSYAANEWIRTENYNGDIFTYIFEDGYPRANAVTPDGRQTGMYGSWCDANGQTVYVKNGKSINDYVAMASANNTGNGPKLADPNDYILTGEALDRVNGIYDEDAYIEEMVELINEERAKVGVDPVELDDEMTEFAMIRAKEISKQYSHKRPDGSVSHIVNKYGENIVRDGQTPEDAMYWWMQSSGHRENILKEKWNKVGVGIYYENNRYYWVQLFSK